MVRIAPLLKATITVLTMMSGHATAQSDDIEWSAYARHASSLAFVTSGLSMVDDCAVPLQFEESSENGLRVLMIFCREEENAAMARLTFYEGSSDPVWLTPWKIELIP